MGYEKVGGWMVKERINFNNAEDNFRSFMKYLHPHDVIYAKEKFLSRIFMRNLQGSVLNVFAGR